MALILNLNMAIDKTVKVEAINKGQTHRYPFAMTIPGGKGINVARALKTLNIKSEIMGFIAGFNGLWIKKALKNEGIRSSLIPHGKGESRICYSVVEERGVSTDFNEDGPDVPKSAQENFLKVYEKKLKKNNIVSISGRTCGGLKKGFYGCLAKKALKEKAPFFADIEGAALKEVIQNNALAVKINNYEFEKSFGIKFSLKAMAEVFKKNKTQGLKFFIVTNRDLPFYCFIEDRLFEVIPPKLLSFQTPVGAGDSFMAGFITAFLKKSSPIETLAFCAAAAASDCETLGAGIIDANKISRYRKLVEIKEILWKIK